MKTSLPANERHVPRSRERHFCAVAGVAMVTTATTALQTYIVWYWLKDQAAYSTGSRNSQTLTEDQMLVISSLGSFLSEVVILES
jgi:hypothetical protein